MAALDDIREQYPQLAWLINDPEIGNLLRQAVNPSTTFSAQRFQAELQKTNWWRTHAQSQREWLILANTDPAEAQRRRSAMLASLNQRSAQIGLRLSGAQQRWIAESMLGMGQTPDSAEVLQSLGRLYKYNPKMRVAGAMRSAQALAAQVARHDYMVPMSLNQAVHWGTQIGTGNRTEQDLRQWAQGQAMSLYPHLRQELQGGQSMRDIFGGHIQMISDELELSPEAVDLRSGRWLKVIDTYDKEQKRRRPLTLSETRTLARQDDRWWKTANGREMDAGMTNTLLRTFGMRK